MFLSFQVILRFGRLGVGFSCLGLFSFWCLLLEFGFVVFSLRFGLLFWDLLFGVLFGV